VGSDYSRRDHRKIFEIYRKGSGAPRASSQDAAKALACDQAGLWRCNTVVPFARYIGASGQHMTPEKFKELGYDNAVMAQSPVLDLDLPGLSGIRERVIEQRKLFESVRRDEFDGIMGELPVRKLNPARPCTRVDIEQAYHLLLRRRVESERLFERHAGRRSVQVLVSAVRMSLEFLDLTDETAEVFTFKDALSRDLCSVADIQAIYALLFHREPDGDTVEQHASKTPIDLLVEGILRSSEFRSLTERFPV